MALSPDQKRELLAELVLGKHRNKYPTLKQFAYFNYGAQGIISAAVIDAIEQAFATLRDRAPFTADIGLEKLAVMRDVKASLGTQLGVSPNHISLADNTTSGCNLALWGFPWKAGDHVIYSDSEYPAVVQSLRNAAKHFDLTLSCWELGNDDDQALHNLAECLRPETRMVLLSHVTWDTGRILPLTEITALCRENGEGRIRVVVDGAQSVGVLPPAPDAWGSDCYAFTGHKWLCGPEGVGGVYIQPDCYEDFQPIFMGANALAYKADGTSPGFHDDGRRYEGSTYSWPLVKGLQAAISGHDQWGSAEERYKRIVKLSSYFWEKMRDAQSGGAPLTMFQEQVPNVGLVFISLPDRDTAALVRGLERKKILIRTVPGTDRIRVSIHYLTLREELDRLADSLIEELS